MKTPVHESEVNAEVWYGGTDREIRGKALCDVGGAARVGVGLLELPCGCNTQPAHWHSAEEEHLYVLEGEGTLHLGEVTHALRPGSYVCFPAGRAVPHHLENTGSVVLRYLMIGERLAHDVVHHVADAG